MNKCGLSYAIFHLNGGFQAPSATLVVKGLSQKTVEDDLYKALVSTRSLQCSAVV